MSILVRFPVCIVVLVLVFSPVSRASELQPQEQKTMQVQSELQQSSLVARSAINGVVKQRVYQDPGAPKTYLIQLQQQPVIAYRQALEKQALEKQALEKKALTQRGKLSTSAKRAIKQQVSAFSKQVAQQQKSVAGQLQQKKLVSKVLGHYQLLVNMLVVHSTPEKIALLRKQPQVKRVVEQHIYSKTLAESVGLVRAPEVWEITDGDGNRVEGDNIDVAIVDTGIDYNHPALGGCFGEGCKVVAGYDFVNRDNDPVDDDGHGTHVAGIVAADSDSLRGVAPKVRLHAYKVLDNFGNGFTTDIIDALEYALDPDGNPDTDDQVDIINMSLGGPGDKDDPLAVAVNNAVRAGITVVVAAGNGGSYGDIAASTPAASELAITVASSDKQDVISTFSSRGPMQGAGFLKPEITAPGTGINSTFLNGELQVLDGTSMASPHVAGAVALLKQLYPQLSPLQIKDRLISGALSIGEDPATQGAGRLNVVASVESVIGTDKVALDFGRVAQESGQWQSSVTFNVSNSSDIEQTISALEVSQLAEFFSVSLPELPVLIPAGGQVELSVTVSLDDAANLPYPTDPSMSYFGVLDIITADATQQIAMAIEHSKQVNVHNTTSGLVQLNLAARDQLNSPGVFVAIPANDTRGVFVPPAVFEGPVLFDILPAEDFPAADLPEASRVWAHSILTFDSATATELTLSLDSVDAFYGIRSVSNAQGALVEDDDYRNWQHESTLVYGDGNSSSLSASGSSNLFYGVGAIQDNSQVAFDALSLLRPPENSEGLNQVVAAHYRSAPGVAASQLIDADITEAHLLNIQFPESYFDNDQRYSISWSTPAFLKFVNIFRAQARSWEFMWVDGYNQGGIDLGVVRRDLSAFFDNVASTGNVHMLDEQRLQKLDFGETPYFEVATDTLQVNGTQLYWMPQILPGENQVEFSQQFNLRNNNGEYFSDMLNNRYDAGANGEFVWLCDDTELSSTTLRLSQPLPELSQETCESLRFELRFDSYFQGEAGKSVVSQELNSANEIFVPAVYEMQLMQQGEIAAQPVLNKIDTQLTLTMETFFAEGALVEMQLGDGQWQNLATFTEVYEGGSDAFSADVSRVVVPLPQNTTPENLSLRITYGDMTRPAMQTLNNIGVLGVEPTGDADDDGIDNATDTDNDNDGVLNEDDAFPFDSAEWLDSDGDLLGNNRDIDDDNDGFLDSEDAFPLDATEHLDTDGDGIGNNADSDDDNDGTPDADDAFPLDASESVDTDGDGIGNNADTDDDNDGTPDSSDAFPLDASRAQLPPPPAPAAQQSGGGGSMHISSILLLMLMTLGRYREKARRTLVAK